ncbi:conserved hypothetical protein [Chloroherpeton thalassium ATCC 35110]|uniref:C_GCAxxG_C_C family protein n=1 Tax=Chloroherpeton thalassium (strain ATCC 35110 / GB-78) TaxID=517418 RepID=B3QYT0_CHLT3|nr:C-GCAxxG-C-C family (seleno)protein [Chloroherpeton thalassium]ACF15153.1 conserved hypothetical protein [Chloroherpeton thalassium ATCC 35110]
MAINKRALKYFQNGFNCAQATLKAYQEEYGCENQDDIDALFTAGRGRVEGGICGSLYAAKQVLKDEELADLLHRSFVKYIGSAVCWEIRSVDKYSCHACVDLNCQLFQKILETKCEMKPVQ